MLIVLVSKTETVIKKCHKMMINLSLFPLKKKTKNPKNPNSKTKVEWI